MLRRCVLAFACLATLSLIPALAEPAKEAAAVAVIAKAEESGATGATSEPEKSAPVKSEPAKSEPAAAAPSAAPANDPKSNSKTAATEPEKASEPAKAAPPPEPTLKVSIDLATQRMTVSEHGSVVYTWPISSGTADHPTPRGTFHPQWTAKMWYSRKYDNAPMPNAVFINGGVAIHATYATGMLGRPASHGCIRLAPGNAKTFYNLVHKHGLKMARVSVYGTPKWSAPAIARRDAPVKRQYASQDSGWGWWDAPEYKKPSYRATSAYDPGFTGKRKAPSKPVYYYSQNTGQVYVRKNKGTRVVLQKVPRKYYYNGYGYGYSSAW